LAVAEATAESEEYTVDADAYELIIGLPR